MFFNRRFQILILGSVLLAGAGCFQGEPEPSGIRGYISTDRNKVYFPGDILELEGFFYNDRGLKEINITNKALGIDYTLDLQGKSVYNLHLVHHLPLLQTPEIHEVQIFVTGINTNDRNFRYMVDYAFQPEIFNMKFSQDPADPDKRYLAGRLEDPHGIRSLELHSLRYGYLIRKKFPDKVYLYELNEDFWFPEGETFGEYPLSLHIVNQRGFSISIKDFEDVPGVGE